MNLLTFFFFDAECRLDGSVCKAVAGAILQSTLIAR
jgi:hypothetical protein